MFTGSNLIERPYLQPEWWPTHFNYERTAEFGAIDAGTAVPAGSTIRYGFNDGTGMPVTSVISRENN